MSNGQQAGVAILGSTGSVGQSTLDVIRLHPDRYRVVALAAKSSVDVMLAQCREFRPDVAVMNDADSAELLQIKLQKFGVDCDVQCGESSLQEVVCRSSINTVMAAIVGAAGLLPTLSATKAGKRVLLANKESLVMSGPLLIEAAAQSGATLLPIDSEHNAIFQCLPQSPDGFHMTGVEKILLTASGGPFLDMDAKDFVHVTPEQAVAHPNWDMGEKISVDSATLMNKGLEVIEACRLFGVEVEQIEVVVHPQSVIHSMVSYADGSVIAQLGSPDMRTPIAHALAWPERMQSGSKVLDFSALAALTFSPPDLERFPCLRLAIESVAVGGMAPTILNAANEVVVQAFLDRQLLFTDIPAIIESVLACSNSTSDMTLDAVLESDRLAREVATAMVFDRSATVARA